MRDLIEVELLCHAASSSLIYYLLYPAVVYVICICEHACARVAGDLLSFSQCIRSLAERDFALICSIILVSQREITMNWNVLCKSRKTVSSNRFLFSNLALRKMADTAREMNFVYFFL